MCSEKGGGSEVGEEGRRGGGGWGRGGGRKGKASRGGWRGQEAGGGGREAVGLQKRVVLQTKSPRYRPKQKKRSLFLTV